MQREYIRIGGILLLAIIVSIAGYMHHVGILESDRNATPSATEEHTVDVLELPTVSSGDRSDTTDATDAIDVAILQGSYAETGNTSDSAVGLSNDSADTALLADVSTTTISHAYDQAQVADDIHKQFAMLQDIYTQTTNVNFLPYLVELAVDVRDFQQALRYIRLLEKEDRDYIKAHADIYFSILFNATELSFQDLSYIKNALKVYHEGGYLDDLAFAKRSAMITYVKGDLDNYAYFMQQLQDTPLDAWYRQHQQNLTLTQSFHEAPAYYIDALTAMQIFQQGMYNVALAGAQRIYGEDPSYILPRQIEAYSLVMLGRRSETLDALARLREHDTTHRGLYRFLGGVAAMHMHNYAEAILAFKDMDTPQYTEDAQRYLLLAYHAIDDFTSLKTVLEDFLGYDDLLPYDYYTLFDLFFYQPLKKDEDVVLYAMYFRIADELIQQCYDDLGEEYAYICLWGKSGRMIANGEHEKAYAGLQRLAQWYPQSFLYVTLGELAYELGKVQDARKWFVYSLAVSDDAATKQKVLDTVRRLLTQ